MKTNSFQYHTVKFLTEDSSEKETNGEKKLFCLNNMNFDLLTAFILVFHSQITQLCETES